MPVIEHPRGDYRFLTGIAPYSSSVTAQPGFVLHRAQFATPQPLQQGFAQIASYLAALGRPRQALCAMELRIPDPLSFEGFISFNSGYRTILTEWEIPVGDL